MNLYKKISLFLTAIITTIFLSPGSYASPDNVRAVLEDGILTLANQRIQRRFMWNNGNLKSLGLTNVVTGQNWALESDVPDIAPFGRELEARDGKFITRKIPATSVIAAHLEAVITFKSDVMDVRRICRIFENVPAINCQLAYRGAYRSAGQHQDNMIHQSREMIENKNLPQMPQGDILEHLALPKGHWSFEVVQFRTATDYNDWLINKDEGEIYRQDQYILGNIIRFEERTKGEQLLIIKEAPSGADQLSWPGYDFIVRDKSIRVVGSGLDPAELDPETWQSAHSVSVVVAQGGQYGAMKALREYRETLRSYRHQRDGMILMNSWGDRSRDSNMNEAFVLKELRAAHKLGLSHFQLDDGWQSGLSKNSSKKEGQMWESWTTEAWQPHPVRFPNGLGPIVKYAQKHKMEIGIWFNPTRKNDYALWRRDAQILIDLYVQHGIHIFKLDGIEIPSLRAGQNLEKFIRMVYEKTNGNVVFNIDVTAGRRPGFIHPLNSYGNIFVENRYTDWGNYYPYRTLRNLWALSAYVPPQFLQMEFLNIWRNKDKYPLDDPYAPSEVSFDYAFAVTMMSQPLAWFEASNLPDEAFEISPVIKRYRELSPKIHAGRIYPIGEQPDGASWTGFQSISKDETSGYILVFREKNDRVNATINSFLPKNHYACFSPELGSGKAFEGWIGQDSQLQLELNKPNSYALYAYKIYPEKQPCIQ